nr:M15 family metallopeptidase [Kibdelosporangium sp. MJ126-NF4]CEL22214.1 D-alanyl-D-alanine carboxypeptidase [Kibdelosporangium sp. MJ126-NF4]CTQ92996.1 D-alanyl-D-alanine carboxypeptidase (EC 3.4.16.4) [Kibdelosporangium sp. MJ126-NF4]
MKSALVALVLALTAACSARAATAQEDGYLENGGISPFDANHPAIRNLDPQLRAAVQQAAKEAKATRGIDARVTSGWRSAKYQQRLLDEAVTKHGSLDEARKFVNTPEKSTHVSGKAVDIGPTDAADWFSRKGSAHGLCQIYSNEMWHIELATTPGGECPPLLTNAAG